MLVLKLILKRVGKGLLDKVVFRLRYLAGLLLFVLVLWLLKLTAVWLVDVKYWDGLRSRQFPNFEQQDQHSDRSVRD